MSQQSGERSLFERGRAEAPIREVLNLGGALARVRASAPLVHCVTNTVTVNDCANALLACGASPIMSGNEEDTREIASICSALCVNLGTPTDETERAIRAAASLARELGKPSVFDPVGAGALTGRLRTALELMEASPFTLVRGNLAEIEALATGQKNAEAHGVDASVVDSGGADGKGGKDEKRCEAIRLARELAERTGSIVAITGAEDVVSDGRAVCAIKNGDPMMRSVTGTGCMLSAICAAFLGAGGEPFEAVCAAVSMMGVCGEIAREALAPGEGSGTFRARLIDAIYLATPEELDRRAQYEFIV